MRMHQPVEPLGFLPIGPAPAWGFREGPLTGLYQQCKCRMLPAGIFSAKIRTKAQGFARAAHKLHN